MSFAPSLSLPRELNTLTPQEQVYCVLDTLKINYQLRRHSPGYEAGDYGPIDKELGATHCKNLFLSNRSKTQLTLLVLLRDKRFDSSSISKQLGLSRLYFGPEELLPKLLGARSGYVSALGLVCDTQRQLQLALDEQLLEFPRVCFHPCNSAATVTLDTKDFLHVFLPALGVKPRMVKAQEQEV